MKTNLRLCLTPASGVALFTFIALLGAEARPGFKKTGKRGAVGSVAALGAAKDKFVAHKRATAGGAGFYSDANREIRRTHVSIYGVISNGLIEGKLTDEDGRSFIDRLFAIGAAAGGKEISEKEEEGFQTRLNKLSEDVRNARLDQVNQDAKTPRINRLQIMQEEIVRFGIDTGELSDGQVASLRRKLDSVEAKEQAAKADGSVSDRERENAYEASREVWQDIIGALTR